MSTDYGEKEREFIASLNDDTGRDLDGWMAAISASTMTNRNDIIDWLRHQGFPFSKASWLERIHHNGGKLIYADTPPARALAAAVPVPSADARFRTAADGDLKVSPVINLSKPSPDKHVLTLPPDVGALLTSAKGLRPLCDLVLNEIAAILPGAKFTAAGPLVAIHAPRHFAALLPGAKKLRIYAEFGGSGSGVVRAADAVNKSPAPFTQMLVLDDARRVDDTFRSLIRAAAERAAGPVKI